MKRIKKIMNCINNTDYEQCLTLNKAYEVELEIIGNNNIMYHLLDDKQEPLQTMIHRFEDVPA